MKSGLIHLCFIIDESGSMSGSESDVCGGFNKLIEEQKALTKGECIVSLYRFESTVKKDFIGRKVSNIGEMKAVNKYGYWLNNLIEKIPAISETKLFDNDLSYSPGGGTAMNDGIGTAINEIGKWLANMPEEERPEKNLIVIMTDGEENSSKEFTIEQVKDMIKHQTDKYDWSFIYMGTDVTNADYANSIGAKSSYTSRNNHFANYSAINSVTTAYRCSTDDHLTKNAKLMADIDTTLYSITADYEKETGININN